ncbi:MAG: hypothetical protein A3H97_22675 [Acidobacteria bacterium RIFCSPLOWO2_02_FULL_65_29]|nr:MAG: hypothetical protein A3H97_22675 [Acidobacteria bacterium RIFCSPLOWO2_02_FULL_65_29]
MLAEWRRSRSHDESLYRRAGSSLAGLRRSFATVMLLLAATFGWLAWRLLVQDQALSAQRLVEQRETAADLVVLALERRLTNVEQDLDRILAGEPPSTSPRASDGALFFEMSGTSIRTWPEKGLVFYPTLPDVSEPPAATFEAAEALEFKRGDYPGAIAALRQASRSDDPRIRAGALVRVARNHLKGGQPRESLSAYAQLADFKALPVAGMPATLAASLGTMAVFERQHDGAALISAARALDQDLHAGHWPLSQAAYRYLSEEVARWLPEDERRPPPRLALAEAALWLWEKSTRDGAGMTSARAGLTTSAGPVLLTWRASATGVAAFAADVSDLQHTWVADLRPSLDDRHMRLAASNPDGSFVIGSEAQSGGRPAIRLASATALPWTIQVVEDGGEDGLLRSRRRLLLAGFSALGLLIVTGAWFIGRAVTRELAVADLQSDFVSAVSHEFRTPLTTLCQLSELLVRDRVASEGDRRQYYELLHHESQRLRRLVEALLTFGRIESGTMRLRVERLDVGALVRESAAEVTAGPHARGCRFELDIDTTPAIVGGDRETLRCVFNNLFENAVKYSPACDTVWVALTTSDSRVEIAVRDRGVGIPRGEQKRIFDKFVRGSAARSSEIRGTGIGLALARAIVRAHGGDITVESALGEGSTFSIVLPTAIDAPHQVPSHPQSEVGLKAESR